MVRGFDNAWRWPEVTDEHNYIIQDIVEIIKTPTITGARGKYKVPKVEKYW